jgi:endonuclease/exonuclease/phosphatase (EEP) superfamily protein YafD
MTSNIRALSFNLGRAFATKLPSIIDYANSNQCDIIALQEIDVFPPPDISPFLLYDNQRSFGGTAILLRKSLRPFVTKVFKHPSGRLTAVRIVLGNTTFVFASVYLPTNCGRSRDLRAPTNVIMDAFNFFAQGSDCCFLLGDLNLKLSKATWLSRALLHDAWEELYPTLPGFTFSASIGGELLSRIDYCLYRGCTLDNVTVSEHTLQSQHRALIITASHEKFSLQPAPPKRRHWKLSGDLTSFTRMCY